MWVLACNPPARARNVSSGVARFDVQTLAEGGKRRLDQIKTRVMPEREETLDMRLRYAEAAGEIRLLQA